VNIGGPEKMSFADLARAVVQRQGGGQRVVVDPHATYFGTPVQRTSLVTGDDGILAGIRFGDCQAGR
jgi:hypothetical protein